MSSSQADGGRVAAAAAPACAAVSQRVAYDVSAVTTSSFRHHQTLLLGRLFTDNTSSTSAAEAEAAYHSRHSVMIPSTYIRLNTISCQVM